MRNVWVEIDALLKRILALEHRTTFGGGGVPAAAHAATHADGESDELDVTDLAGFPGGSPLLYLDSDGDFTNPGGNSFGRVAVSGQSDVVADAAEDTLTLVAGSNVTITTTPGSDSVTIAASGSAASFSGAMVKKSANQTGANYTGGVNIAFDSEVYDVGGWHDNVTNNTRLTVPSGVSYVVCAASVTMANVGTGETIFLLLFKNGSATGVFDGAVGQVAYTGITTDPTISFSSGAIPVSAGDYFEAWLLVAADTSIDITAARCMFSIRAVG